MKLQENKKHAAQKYILKADELLTFVKDKHVESKYYLIKGKLQVQNNEYKKALYNLNLAKLVIEKTKSLLLKIDYIKTFASLEKKRRQLEKSL